MPAEAPASTVSSHALARKQAAHEAHFIQRARRRFGLRVSHERYLRFCRVVVEAEGTIYLGAHPPFRTIWLVRLAGHLMRVVYDESTDRLVTCLPFREQSGEIQRDTVFKRRRLAAKSGKRKAEAGKLRAES